MKMCMLSVRVRRENDVYTLYLNQASLFPTLSQPSPSAYILYSHQVYSFGTGAYGQFAAPGKDGLSTKNSPFVGFDEIAELWAGRVVPAESFLAHIGRDEPDAKKLEDMKVNRVCIGG